MGENKYQLRYLPLFYDDLREKVLYISEELRNIDAANRLVDSVERAIKERLPMAESFEQYKSLKERRYPYYRIYVDNFIVYYVVIDEENGKKVKEVRRLLYRGQNRDVIV